MNDTNTFVSANVISSNDSECAVSRLVCEIWEEGLIAIANKLCSLYCLYDLGLFAEYLFKIRERCFTGNENSVLKLNESIVKLLTYCKAEIRRKCPGGGCPCKIVNILACL